MPQGHGPAALHVLPGGRERIPLSNHPAEIKSCLLPKYANVQLNVYIDIRDKDLRYNGVLFDRGKKTAITNNLSLFANTGCQLSSHNGTVDLVTM